MNTHIDHINKASDKIMEIMKEAINNTNEFCSEKILTRGGRVGSGMGTLLEALWGFNMNQILLSQGTIDYEIGWFPDNEYNDFACVKKDTLWEPSERRGELFRIEIKSMNKLADEAKGHFDEIIQNLGLHDLLVVLLWSWKSDNGTHYYPYIEDYFIGNAIEIAKLRDELHVKRGGWFIVPNSCPDNCKNCTHIGEPINAKNIRERSSGPESCKPNKSTKASNFGGLVRMLKTSNDNMRHAFRKIRKENDTANRYITFIHTNFPAEEENQYTAGEWFKLAEKLGVKKGKNKKETIKVIREQRQEYRETLRYL